MRKCPELAQGSRSHDEQLGNTMRTRHRPLSPSLFSFPGVEGSVALGGRKRWHQLFRFLHPTPVAIVRESI
jgi:hypothetical protein